MRFQAPAYLHWLWLALLPLVLWLFRRQAKQVHVSTLLFFRTLAREHQESAWLRQLKRWLSLLLTLLVLISLILALAQPTRDYGDDGTAGIVFVLDHSASMSVTVNGKTRLQQAKERLLERLQAAPSNTVFSLVTVGAENRVPLSLSRNRRELARLLDAVAPEPAEDRTDDAWQMALRLAQLDRPAAVVHLSDAAWAKPTLPADVTAHDEVFAAGPVVNVGITAFDLRPAPLDQHHYDVFVRVAAAAANGAPVSSEVEMKIGGRLAHLREVLLNPGEDLALLVPLEGVKGEPMELRCRTAGDAMAMDDAVMTTLPTPKPLVVAWLSENPEPFTELALSAMVEAGRVEMLKGTPANWPLKDEPDVLVLENWIPPTAPELPFIILNAQGQATWFKASSLARPIPIDPVRNLQPEHPVTYGITTSRLSLTLGAELPPTPGLEPLWIGGGGNLLLAGELAAQRTVVTAFSPSQSEQLALQPAYPLLLANAIHWCAEALPSRAAVKPLRTGSLLEVEGSVRWQTPHGPVTDTAEAGAMLVRRTGSWETEDGRQGCAVPASAHETDVPAMAANAATSSPSSPVGRWQLTGSSLLLWFVLVLLLLESWLFHRRAVY